MKTLKYIFIFLLSILPLSACSEQSGDSVTFMQNPAFKIHRFDKDLHDYLQNQTPLDTLYAEFLPAFGRITINSPDSHSPEFPERLRNYFSNDMLAKIYLDELKTFEDVTAYEQELSQIAGIVSTGFSGKKMPNMYLHVSGFKENVIVSENAISVSADKYLGSDYPGYKQFFKPYRLIQMQPKLITRDYLKAWILSDLLPLTKNTTLLDGMIREGKVLYVLSKLLPDWAVNDLISYTPEQEAWCNDNEKKIWHTIVKSNDLYSVDYLLIGRYMNDAPYTATLGTQSPGRTGAWIGWRIVQAYASPKNISLEQLFFADSQKILKESGYNP